MIDKHIITHLNPKSPISEAYRMLRTNIHYSNYDKKLKAIVVTSSGPGEGKTTTICNLAVAIAQTGQKVLLIDADLRKPKIHKHFNLTNVSGITNIIAENTSYNTLLKQVEGIAYMDVMTSGPIPPNPSELLGSQRMRIWIEEMRSQYDMILVDAPPVGSVTDAAILSTFLDGVIMVISSGDTTIQAAQRSKGLLEKVNANILGVVVNKIQKSTAGSYYYYYYDSYYEEDQKAGRKKKRGRPKEFRKQKREMHD